MYLKRAANRKWRVSIGTIYMKYLQLYTPLPRSQFEVDSKIFLTCIAEIMKSNIKNLRAIVNVLRYTVPQTARCGFESELYIVLPIVV